MPRDVNPWALALQEHEAALAARALPGAPGVEPWWFRRCDPCGAHELTPERPGGACGLCGGPALVYRATDPTPPVTGPRRAPARPTEHRPQASAAKRRT